MNDKSPTEILDEPISTDDLTEEIREAGGGPSKVTIGLLVAVLMIFAFGAGIWLRSAIQSGPGPVTEDRGSTVLTGTVQRSSGGNTVQVAGPDGRVTTVTLPPKDQVFVAHQGDPALVRPGAQVRVEGSSGGRGGFAAQRVTVTGG